MVNHLDSVEEKDIIEFEFANRVVTHLGRNLYRSTAPAIAELVANSYDAYSTNCYITTDFLQDQIAVADDGVGLSLDGVRSEYAKIGKRKVAIPTPPGMTERFPMGKKGIGKLASFSLGEKMTVFFKSPTDEEWRCFSLDFSSIQGDYPKFHTPCFISKTPPKGAINPNQGFVVIIENLRRGITARTLSSIEKLLSHRFYIESNKGFNLFLNGKSLDLQTHAYFSSLVLLTYIGYTKSEMNGVFPNIEDKYLYDYINSEQVTDVDKATILKGIKGWLGTTSTPKGLKIGDNEMASIFAFMNGKMVDEDFLRGNKDARIANQYIVGEFNVDYLNSDVDLVTSSRQGLDIGDEDVAEIIPLVLNMRRLVFKKWDEYRESQSIEILPVNIKENTGFKTWIGNLDSKSRLLANKLFSTVQKISENDPNESNIRSMYAGCISMVSDRDSWVAIESAATQDNWQEIVKSFFQAFKNLSISESMKHFDLLQKRMKVLEKLNAHIDNEEIEIVFQQTLADNPWLINPYWNKSSYSMTILELKTNEFYRLYDLANNAYKRCFIDILIYPAECALFPVIIELKRAKKTEYSSPTVGEIIDQINKYRDAILQKVSEKNDLSPDNRYSITAYMIAENHNLFPKADLDMLKAVNIIFMQYRDIIENAYKLYSEHVKLLEESADIRFIDDIVKPESSEE